MMDRNERRFRTLRRATASLAFGALSLFDVAAWAAPPLPVIGGFGTANEQMPTEQRQLKKDKRRSAAMQTHSRIPAKGVAPGKLSGPTLSKEKRKVGKAALQELPAVQMPAPARKLKREGPRAHIQPGKQGKLRQPMSPSFGKAAPIQGLHLGTTPLPSGGVPASAAPRGGSGDGRGIREAARQIREDASRRNSIRLTGLSGFTGYEGQCAGSGEPLVLAGYGFGEARGSRQIVLERRGTRSSSVAAYLRTDSWSDGRVTAAVPSGLDEGQTYRILVQDSAGRHLSNSLSITACRTRGRVVVNMDTSWCAYSTDQVIVEARNLGGRAYSLGAMTGSHDFDVVFGSDSLPLGRYSIEASFRGDPCPGGMWSGSPNIHISHDDPLERVTLNYDVTMTETPLAVSLVEGLLRSSFRGLQVRLNNYDPARRGGTRFLPGDAFIDLPEALGGRRIALDLPEIREGAFRYYVQDLNLDGIHVGHEGERFHVRLDFESAGNELKGHCFGDLTDGCLAGSDSSAPDGHVNRVAVDIFFDAIRYNVGGGTGGDVSIGNVEVSMSADLAINGILGPIFELIEGEIQGRVIPPLEANLRAQLSTRAFQTQVAEGIRSATGGLIGNVQGVNLVGSNLIVRHVPRS
ncbi:MAG: hypothetical protein GY937_25650 [bacterium]|nr:hypothetical protein [bacterium]